MLAWALQLVASCCWIFSVVAYGEYSEACGATKTPIPLTLPPSDGCVRVRGAAATGCSWRQPGPGR